MAALAPISTPRLHSVILPDMESASAAGPMYSTALYVAPSAPNWPMTIRAMSFAETLGLLLPERRTAKVSGTLNHSRPRE